MSPKKILLAGFILITSLCAESKILFALNNQYFSETMQKEKTEKPKAGYMIGARYDVGDVIVSTNLARWSTGVLGTLNKRKDGYLIVDVKEPINQWTVSINVSYAFFGECTEAAASYSIRLGANNGESIYITTNPCDVVVQDKQFKLKKKNTLDNSALNYFIKTNQSDIIVMLNGQTLIKLPKGDFDKFKTVEMGVGTNKYGLASHIKNLTIGQK